MSGHLLADALQRSESYHAVATATTKRALQLLGKARSDNARFEVALIGISPTKGPPSSIQFLRQVRSLHPDLGTIALLDMLDRTVIVEALRAGARGVFCRSESFESLCKCIRCVHEGQVWVNSTGLQFVLEEVAARGPLAARLPGSRRLSKREEQITALVAEGYSNRQISERLDLSEHTIKNYLFRVFEKLGVSTRVGLTLYALKAGKTSREKLQSLKQQPAGESPPLDKNSERFG